MKRANWFKVGYLFLVINIVFMGQAYAYIDPGSGSLVLQIILGTIAAVATVVKIFWYKIKFVFIKLFTKKGDQK